MSSARAPFFTLRKPARRGAQPPGGTAPDGASCIVDTPGCATKTLIARETTIYYTGHSADRVSATGTLGNDMTHRFKLAALVMALGLLVFGPRPASADAPSVIRIAYPGVGVGNRPVVGGNSATTVHLKGLLEDEFRKDGIQ